MNTRKQVLLMSGLLLIVLMVLGVYAAWYPYRATDAAVEFEDSTAERGSIIFARTVAPSAKSCSIGSSSPAIELALRDTRRGSRLVCDCRRRHAPAAARPNLDTRHALSRA